MKKHKSKSGLCHWNCYRKTSNHSGICDQCWKDREIIYLARKSRGSIEASERTVKQLKATVKLIAFNKARRLASSTLGED